MAGFRLQIETPAPVRLPVQIDGEKRDIMLRPFSLSDHAALARMTENGVEWFERVDEGEVEVAIAVLSRQIINGDALATELGGENLEDALNKSILPGTGQIQAMMLPVMSAYLASMPEVKKKSRRRKVKKTTIWILTTSLFAFCGGLAVDYKSLIEFLLSLPDRL